MASQVNDSAWLEWIARLGIASRQRLTATLPPGKFHCLLDELPLHLIPQREVHGRRGDREELGSYSLNPLCSILSAGNVPAELGDRRDLMEGFDLRNSIAWVRDPATNWLHPFWMGSTLEGILAQVRSGELPVASLPREWFYVLSMADVLSLPGQAERRIDDWRAMVERGAKVFREKNYAPLRNLIHPFHVAALRRYYRHAIRTGAIQLGDEQSPRRYVVHNSPVARFFHHQIASSVSAIVGEPVKPSYVYFASYLSGAELKKHTDRAQCEFSVTLCLDFSPEPEPATPWPIRLDIAGGTVTVYQALGDGLVYRGTKVPHYRDKLAQGCASTSIFFHYVPEDFPGPLD